MLAGDTACETDRKARDVACTAYPCGMRVHPRLRAEAFMLVSSHCGRSSATVRRPENTDWGQTAAQLGLTSQQVLSQASQEEAVVEARLLLCRQSPGRDTGTVGKDCAKRNPFTLHREHREDANQGFVGDVVGLDWSAHRRHIRCKRLQTGPMVVGGSEVKSWGGRVALIPFVEGWSTSNIVKKASQTS